MGLTKKRVFCFIFKSKSKRPLKFVDLFCRIISWWNGPVANSYKFNFILTRSFLSLSRIVKIANKAFKWVREATNSKSSENLNWKKKFYLKGTIFYNTNMGIFWFRGGENRECPIQCSKIEQNANVILIFLIKMLKT